MTTSTPLRGMTWDHPRGTGPAHAATTVWVERHPDVELIWDARPLSAFEDQPISELVADYDVLMIDHPHVGGAVAQQALLDLGEWVAPDFLRDQCEQSVGPSYASYTYAGRQWALAVDAAAQVGAYRADLVDASGAELPRTWEDVAALARRSCAGGARLLLPLNPTHAWCTLLSLVQSRTVALDTVTQWTSAFEDALETLAALVPDLDPRSEDTDPIAAGRLATQTDQVLGVPLAFGYVTFARAERSPGRWLTHVDAPRGEAGFGSVLGGVGLAISARTAQPELAAELAMLVASAEFQCHQLVDAGGQPGHRSAWLDQRVDLAANRFFSSTIASLEAGFVRRRDELAAVVQRRCGHLVHERLWTSRTSTAACAQDLGRLMADLHPTQERP